MYRDATGAQVAHAQDCTYNIPSQVIENQDLPYRPAICTRYGAAVGRDAPVGAILVFAIGHGILIEVQDLADRGCASSLARTGMIRQHVHTPIWRSLRVRLCDAMA